MSTDILLSCSVGANGAVVNGFIITGSYTDGVAYDSHSDGMIN